MIWQVQPAGQPWTAPHAVVLGCREQFGACQRVLDGAEVGVGIGEVLGDPPALDAAVGQGLRRDDQLAGIDGLGERLADRVDPDFRGEIRVALFLHRGEGGHRVAGDQRGVAAVALLEDDPVDLGDDLGRGPVHARDGDVAAFLGIGGVQRGRGEQDARNGERDQGVAAVDS